MVNLSVLVRVNPKSVVITLMSLSISKSIGASHCSIRSSVSEPPSSIVIVQVREKGCPAVSVPGGDIMTLGEGAKEWMDYISGKKY